MASRLLLGTFLTGILALGLTGCGHSTARGHVTPTTATPGTTAPPSASSSSPGANPTSSLQVKLPIHCDHVITAESVSQIIGRQATFSADDDGVSRHHTYCPFQTFPDSGDDLQIDLGDSSDAHNWSYLQTSVEGGGTLPGIIGTAKYYGDSDGGRLAVIFGQFYISIEQGGNEVVSEDAMIQLAERIQQNATGGS